MDELLAQLRDYSQSGASPSKIKNVIDKLGNLADRKALEPVKAFLTHEVNYVKVSAIKALEKIRGDRSLPAVFLERLKTETASMVRIALVEALSVLGDEKVVPYLVSIRDDPETPDDMKINVIFAIDRLTGGKISALDQLVEYLIDAENPNTRVEAAKTLGKLGDPRAIKFLVEALDDPKIFVRKFVIKALVSFRDKSVVDPIIAAFTDEEHFLERDFIKVLWEFPEYKGKELWEIIELRNQERLNELDTSLLSCDDAGEGKSIKDEYLYEVALAEGAKNALEAGNSDGVTGAGGGEAMDRVESRVPCGSGGGVPEKDYQSLDRVKEEPVPKPDLCQETGDDTSIEAKRERLRLFGENFNKGERYMRKKRYYEALMSFKAALELKYDAWQAWYNMALVFYEVNEKRKALECFLNSYRYKPNEVDTLLNIGSIYREFGKNEKAIYAFVKALKLNRYMPDAWLVLGKIFKKLKKYEFAVHCFNEVLQQSKNKKERSQARRYNREILSRRENVNPRDPTRKKFSDPGLMDIDADIIG